jgi:hypothetical protein
MPERRTEDARHIAELIPNGLLRSGQSHHPVVLQEAMARSQSAQLRLRGEPAFSGTDSGPRRSGQHVD